GLAPGSTSSVELAPLQPGRAGDRGTYALGVKFDTAAPLTLDRLDGGQAGATTTPASTLALTQNSLFHFSLAAAGLADATLTMTVTDALGNVVLALVATAGLAPATATVYLRAGTYGVRYSARRSDGGAATLNFWLWGKLLSDPVGPYRSDTTSTSTA